jgi:glycosyltransferase involved in cell wall biosynthesis
MARVYMHAAAATAGGGLTYLLNVAPLLGRAGAGAHEWHILVPDAHAHAASAATAGAGNVTIEAAPRHRLPMDRLRYDQFTLRRRLVNDQFDAVVATGNFGLVRPPVPQILYSRNDLYFSDVHCRELRRRGSYKEWLRIRLRRKLALASIRSSTINITPTRAFRDHIKQFGRVEESTFRTVHHGFDADRFRAGGGPLRDDYRALLGPPDAAARILFVSHYNYFRNFDTVLRAVAALKGRTTRPVQLVLTTRLADGLFEHKYDTTQAARLIDSLGIRDQVAMLGHVRHEDLYPVYRACDVVVCPSYAETFGHPMVEAMSSGLPVVATNMDVHREVCEGGALYFNVFDPDDLAAKIATVLEDSATYDRLASAGTTRARAFSWETHVRELVALIDEVTVAGRHPNAAGDATASPAAAADSDSGRCATTEVAE